MFGTFTDKRQKSTISHYIHKNIYHKTALDKKLDIDHRNVFKS